MEFQDKVNAFLISTTHYFAISRRADLAIANVLALMSMSSQNKQEKTLLIVNAAVTYSMGYSYFLQHDMMSGIYMFMLGLLCFGTAVSDTLQYILNDWNDRFRIRKEVVYDESESESEEEDTEGPNPAERVTPVESQEIEEEPLLSETASAPVSSTAEQTTAPEPSVQSQSLAPESSGTVEQTTAPEPPPMVAEEPASAPIPATEPLAE